MSSQRPFSEIEKAIKRNFKDKDILALALTHRSHSRKGSAKKKHNERLEFLGDAVLELVVTDYLFHYSERSEGELTTWRAALVKGENLAAIARDLQLGKYLFMSRGEEASGGREKTSTLANTLEAIIGALYIDQGFEAAKDFCQEFILSHLETLLAQGKHRDHKSDFQERSQELLGVTPHYEVMNQEGPDHDKTFTCAVFIGSDEVAQGTGNSKQKAEQAAAKKGLKKKKWN